MEGRDRADLARAGVEANQLPRVRLMPSFTPSSVCADGPAEADQDVRIGELDLALDEGQADLALLRRRRAVAGRAPRNDVGDVGAGAVEADRRHHQVEQLAGASDEGQALEVLLAARRLADEHHARLRIAVREHELLGGGAQRAAFELRQHGAQLVEARGAARGLARRHHGDFRRRRRAGRRCDRGARRAAGCSRAARPLGRAASDRVGAAPRRAAPPTSRSTGASPTSASTPASA